MADQMSIRDIINTIEDLEVDDTIEVTDENGNTHAGYICELQRDTQERRWLVKGDDTTDDHVLHIYYDHEGGPITAELSFEDKRAYTLTAAEQTN